MTREHYEARLHALDDQIVALGELVATTIDECVSALEAQDVVRAQALIAADDTIDSGRYQLENEAFLLIATQQPLAGDLRAVIAIVTIASELERIGDYCEGIAELTLRIAGEPLATPVKPIEAMSQAVQQLLRAVLQAFLHRDLDAAGRVWMQDDVVDGIYEEVFRDLIAQMAEDSSTVRRNTYLLWVAHNLERMADRVTNIAEQTAFVVTGNIAAFRDQILARTPPS